MRCLSLGLAAIATAFLAGCGATLNDGTQASAGTQQSAPAMALTSGSAATEAKPNSTITGSITLDAKQKEAVKQIAVSDPSSTAYKIGPLDVVEVSVFKVPDLSRTVQVADSGSINLPLVGEIPAAGRTAQDIERDLTKRLGQKYLQNPQVNIFVKEYNSQRVTVDGSVRKPGVYPVRGNSTLLQLIAMAEGFTDTAESEVVIFREVDGTRSAAKFDVSDIRSGKIQDPQVKQGDAIVVSDSAVKSAYQNLLKALPISTLFVTLL